MAVEQCHSELNHGIYATRLRNQERKKERKYEWKHVANAANLFICECSFFSHEIKCILQPILLFVLLLDHEMENPFNSPSESKNMYGQMQVQVTSQFWIKTHYWSSANKIQSFAIWMSNRISSFDYFSYTTLSCRSILSISKHFTKGAKVHKHKYSNFTIAKTICIYVSLPFTVCTSQQSTLNKLTSH